MQNTQEKQETSLTITEQRIAEIASILGCDPSSLTITEDCIVVTSDGEVVGVMTPEEFVAEVPEGHAPPLMSEDLVAWVMKKKLKFEARKVSASLYAEEARLEVVRIENEAVEAAINAARMTPEWIESNAVYSNSSDVYDRAEKSLRAFDGYDSELARYAKANFEGKSKTLRTPYGSISIRKNPDKVEFVDEDRVIEWAEENAPDAIKASVQVSKLPKELTDFVKEHGSVINFLMNAADDAVRPEIVPDNVDELFVVVRGEEKVTISANIEGVK